MLRFLTCALLLVALPSIAIAEDKNIIQTATSSVSSTVQSVFSKVFGVSVDKSKEEDKGVQPKFIDLEEQKVLTMSTKDGEKIAYQVSVARTDKEMSNGLMWRKYMPLNVGMMFVFTNNAERSFWMKNTYMPLDILFMDGDGKITHIHKDAVPLDLSRILSKGPAKMVLELNAGQVEKHGYKVGDIVGGAARLNK